MEDIVLYHFSASNQSKSEVSDKEVSCQEVFNSFLSDDNKQNSATDYAHTKHLL